MPFFALTRFARPYVTLKWAQSADGLMGGSGNTPRRISGPQSSRLVHMLRTRSDAIAISADTVMADDPLLTPRDVPILRTPVRIILDAHLRTPERARLVQTAEASPVHVFTAATDLPDWPGVVFHQTPLAGGHLDLQHILRDLGQLKITHLLIEPGPRLARAFLQQNLADRIWVISSPNPLGEPNAPAAPAVTYPATLALSWAPTRLPSISTLPAMPSSRTSHLPNRSYEDASPAFSAIGLRLARAIAMGISRR